MSDVIPNRSLERQRLELDKSQLEHNIRSQEYRIAQIEDEKSRLLENIEATKVSIKSLDEQISNLKPAA